jgi:SAM-dependent methyltransferase
MSDIDSWSDSKRCVHRGIVFEELDGFKIIQCELCNFKHAIPLPNNEDLQQIYSEEYYSIEKPLYIQRYIEDKKWWDLTYEQRYSLFESHLELKGRSILDVGSGPGLFLAKGRELGWKTKGIEPSKQAAEYSRKILKLDIEMNFLDINLAKKMGKFDVVNLGEVVEHLPDPEKMLQLIHSLLNDNGLILVIVPNDFNPFQVLLNEYCGYDPWWITPPHHLNYFDKDSLSRLLERCGFDVVHNETTFPIDMFLLMGDNYIGNDELGRSCHKKRMNFDFNLAKNPLLNLHLREALSKLDLGRELVILARKITK